VEPEEDLRREVTATIAREATFSTASLSLLLQKSKKQDRMETTKRKRKRRIT
jgi:hypothetical protein